MRIEKAKDAAPGWEYRRRLNTLLSSIKRDLSVVIKQVQRQAAKAPSAEARAKANIIILSPTGATYNTDIVTETTLP